MRRRSLLATLAACGAGGWIPGWMLEHVASRDYSGGMQMNPFKSSMAVLGLASLAVLPLAGQTGGAGTATQPAKPAGQTGTAKPGAGGHSMEGMQAGKASTADAKFVH